MRLPKQRNEAIDSGIYSFILLSGLTEGVGDGDGG